MSRRFIITLTAANQVGILSVVTNALAELGGNLVQMHVDVVQKFFTMIMSADFPDHREQEVVSDHIRDMARPFSMEVCVKDPAREQVQDDFSEGTQLVALELHGHDEFGVLRAISSQLAQEGVDIVQLSSGKGALEESFEMRMQIAVPPGLHIPDLVSRLTQQGEKFGLTARMASTDSNPPTPPME